MENSIIPIVIPSHPYDFLGNIKMKIGYLEKFISKLIQLPNVEFVTLNKIRKDYIDKKNSYNVKKPALIITASDILKILKPVKGAWNKILNLVS